MSESASVIAKAELKPSAASEAISLTYKQRIVVWSAAILLLTAAVLKAWPMVTGQAIDTQAASLGKLILIQGEVALALWLMSGINAVWSFRAAIVFFAGATTMNLRSIWLREISCGCFGTIEVPPSVSLAVNSVVISALVLMRPQLASGLVSSAITSVRSMGWAPPICVLILAIGAAGVFARNLLRPVVIETPREIDLGVLEAGAKKDVVISLRNVSDKPVTVVGAKTSCTCSLVKGLPIEIGAGKSAEVLLSVIPPSKNEFEGSVIYYSNNKNASNIRCRYFAHINVAPTATTKQ